MSNVKIQGNASGTGTLTFAAPNTNTDRTIDIPDGDGEIVVASSGVLPAYDGSLLTGIASGFTKPTAQVFTSSGTWTKPTGCTSIRVFLVGGGGGSYDSTIYRCGGNPGGCTIKYIDVTSITSETVTIGSGGAIANAGGTTSFGSHCSATGGAAANSGSANTAAQGTGVGGDINLTGMIAYGWSGNTSANKEAEPSIVGDYGRGSFGNGAGVGGIAIIEEYY